MVKQLYLLILFFAGITANAQMEGYFVAFTDKEGTPYSIEQPNDFLSARAIERRLQQGIEILPEDLPVTPAYIDSLKKAGLKVWHTTKWLNGAIVFSDQSQLMDTLDRVSFVDWVEKTKSVSSSLSAYRKMETSHQLQLKGSNSSIYGQAWDQIRTVNGHLLHEQNNTGSDIHIAVIDAGFYGVDYLPYFENLHTNNQILGSKDFVDPSSNIFREHKHGMEVLSIMGGQSNLYKGTAPDASYWLLRTEDDRSETPIEADYWICAAEFADSVGVDIINTSLGYYEFDDPTMSYSYADMNGSTRISSASDIASSKGMLIVTSAGNEGNSDWKYIGTPADAKNCISVGAITVDSIKAAFSSLGPTFDQIIKPEVCAVGVNNAIQSTNGGVAFGNGTSFSAPVISGLAACLWQAFPQKKASEIRQMIIESANQYDTPDNLLGYGIPDFRMAYGLSANNHPRQSLTCNVAPNPFSGQLKLTLPIEISGQEISLVIYDLAGNMHLCKKTLAKSNIYITESSELKEGIYILAIEHPQLRQHLKIIKSH